MEKISLKWSRFVIHSRHRSGESYQESIKSLYESLINTKGYRVVKTRGQQIVAMPTGINYGDRVLQRRRTYEIMELIRDATEERTVEYDDGEVIYKF